MLLEKCEQEYYLRHFPKKISKGIKDFATDRALLHSRYIFTRREGKQQYGYCTHCKKEYKTDGLRHNVRTKCPKCKSECQIKSSGMGRKTLIDEVYFVYYEKSLLDPQAIIASGIYAVRDYSRDYKKVKTQYAIKAMYIFEVGQSTMIEVRSYYSRSYTQMFDTNFYDKCKTIYSLFDRDHVAYIAQDCSYESIRKAVKGTPFQYSTWESYMGEYARSDMVKFFDLYCKYPCIEYLTKLGFSNLVDKKLNNWPTYSAVNWRGKTLEKVLKISKQEISQLKSSNIDVDFLFLKLLQISKKEGSKLSLSDINDIKQKSYFQYFNDLQQILKRTSLRKTVNYIDKQYSTDKKNHYYSRASVLTTWKDYIADCIKLGVNLEDKQVLFPKNLYGAHQNTIKQIKIKANEKYNKKIKARLKGLKKYCFEYEGLMIRPASSTNELIEEGEALTHCVGTYADRYASGKTNILLIRKINEPDKPYFTVELRGNMITQVRGKNNCEPEEDVEDFIEIFKSQKLNKKKKEKKIPA